MTTLLDDLTAERFNAAWWDNPPTALDYDDPRHGTYAGAIAHWKGGERPCGPCALAARRAGKAARLDRHRGNPRTVNLGEAWAVIGRIPLDQLARASGLKVDKLIRLRKGGPDKLVHRHTRDRILEAAALPYWTPIGIQRRLRALTAAGWSMRALAAESGLDYDALKRLRAREDLQFVRRNVAETIVATYERLCMTRPEGRGATRARREALAAQWGPPLAWDNVDDPRERAKGLGADKGRPHTDIEPEIVARLLSLELVESTRAEKEEAMRQWLAKGRSERSLCEAHGWQAGRYLTHHDTKTGAA